MSPIRWLQVCDAAGAHAGPLEVDYQSCRLSQHWCLKQKLWKKLAPNEWTGRIRRHHSNCIYRSRRRLAWTLDHDKSPAYWRLNMSTNSSHSIYYTDENTHCTAYHLLQWYMHAAIQRKKRNYFPALLVVITPSTSVYRNSGSVRWV